MCVSVFLPFFLVILVTANETHDHIFGMTHDPIFVQEYIYMLIYTYIHAYLPMHIICRCILLNTLIR